MGQAYRVSPNSLPENRDYHPGQRSQPVQRPNIECDPDIPGSREGILGLRHRGLRWLETVLELRGRHRGTFACCVKGPGWVGGQGRVTGTSGLLHRPEYGGRLQAGVLPRLSFPLQFSERVEPGLLTAKAKCEKQAKPERTGYQFIRSPLKRLHSLLCP